MYLAGASDLRAVGFARTGKEAVQLAAVHRPEVVLLDLRLPDLPAREVVRQLRAALPEVAIVIFTGYADVASGRELLRLGVRGWLCKTATRDEVVGAIRTVAGGREVFDHGVVRAAL